MSLPAPLGVFRSHKDLQSWFLQWLGSLDEVELVTGMMALYQLWLARNNARDCPMIEDTEDIAGRIVGLLEEWHGLRGEASTSSPKPVGRWSPPRVGWHKANVVVVWSCMTTRATS
jgi:hypothetical protein